MDEQAAAELQAIKAPYRAKSNTTASATWAKKGAFGPRNSNLPLIRVEAGKLPGIVNAAEEALLNASSARTYTRGLVW
jgi:hypothetical protein